MAVRHLDADPATRSRGARLRQRGGRGGLGGLSNTVISAVSQKLGSERERDVLLAASHLDVHQRKPEGPCFEFELQPEPELEPETVGSLADDILPAAPVDSCRDDDVRDGIFAAYLNRVEEKGCAWRQELNRCGITLTFDASPRTSASIFAAQRLAAAAQARRDTALTTVAPAADGPVVSRGKVMVRSTRNADWVSGEIASIDEATRIATVQYGSNSTVRVLLTDPTRVRLVPPPPQTPDALTH